MKVKSHRITEQTVLQKIIALLHKYAYAETVIILAIYFTIGYVIDPQDICILHADISYILILLAIITLFHGFENGILAMSVIAFFMWYFYEVFEYIDFLMAVMMTMIYSEFYYYWTKKIKAAEVLSNYRGTKLDELTKSFYTLKISHEQLEKNYIVKPMSIRNSIEHIIQENKSILKDDTVADKNQEYYKQFMKLLEKSFHVENAEILYVNDIVDEKGNVEEVLFTKENVHVAYGSKKNEQPIETLLKDYLVDKVLAHKSPVFISDEVGNPAEDRDSSSEYIAVIPALQEGRVVTLLLIKSMPFMAYDRENLTSITILLEYFSIEIRNKNILDFHDDLTSDLEEDFRFEYARLQFFLFQYGVHSTVLVLRFEGELQALYIYEKVKTMLRSLDMVSSVRANGLYYVVLLFPLHDKSVALGYLHRLHSLLKEEERRAEKSEHGKGKFKEFDSIAFDLSQTELFNKYLREDYDS